MELEKSFARPAEIPRLTLVEIDEEKVLDHTFGWREERSAACGSPATFSNLGSVHGTNSSHGYSTVGHEGDIFCVFSPTSCFDTHGLLLAPVQNWPGLSLGCQVNRADASR